MKDLTPARIGVLLRRMGSSTQQKVLIEEGISYGAWRRALDRHGIAFHPSRGYKPVRYALPVLQEVQRRARVGEFIRDICQDLDLDYVNLCRACRRKGIRLLDKAALRANLARRRRDAVRRVAGQPPKSLKIYEALAQGATWQELLRRFCISRTYAITSAKRYREGYRPGRTRRDLARRALVVKLAEQGQTGLQIATRLGCSRQNISLILRSEGWRRGKPVHPGRTVAPSPAAVTRRLR